MINRNGIKAMFYIAIFVFLSSFSLAGLTWNGEGYSTSTTNNYYLNKDLSDYLTNNESGTVDGNFNVTAGNDICITGGNCLSSPSSFDATSLWNAIYGNYTERVNDNTTLTNMINSVTTYNDTNLWNDLYLNSTERLADNATLSLFNINQSSQFDINQSSQFDINQSSQFDINQTGDIFTKYQESNNTFTELNTERIADNTTLTSMIAALSSYDDSWINATYNYLLNNLYLNSTQVDSLWSDLHLNSTRTDAIETYTQANSTDQLNIWSDLQANSTQQINDNASLNARIDGISTSATQDLSNYITNNESNTIDGIINTTGYLLNGTDVSSYLVNQSSQFDINQSSQFDINQSSKFDINQSSQFDINQSSQFDINQTIDIHKLHQDDNNTLNIMIAAISVYNDAWINATYNYLLNNLYLNSTQVDSLWSDLHLNSTRTDAIEIYAQANSTDQLNIWSDLQANSTERIADNTTLTSMISSLSFEDTNASTACSTDEVLLGNGSCMTSSSFIQSEYDDTNLWNDLYLNSTQQINDNLTQNDMISLAQTTGQAGYNPSNLIFNNESEQKISGNLTVENLTSTGYIDGQPLDGTLDSGIIYAAEFDGDGNINLTNPDGTLSLTYPDFKVRLVNTNNQVKYCSFTSDTVTVTDNQHSIYYIDSNCNLQSTTVQTYLDTDISPGGITDIFNVMAHTGEVELLQGSPIQSKINIKSKRKTFSSDNLKVTSGLGFYDEAFPNFTISNGAYVYILDIVTTSIQNSSLGNNVELIYKNNGEWNYTEQDGINVTSCDDGTDIIDCTNPSKYRRYYLFISGFEDGTDKTEVHQLATLDSESYANIGSCLDTVNNPITYELPDIYTYSLVPLYIYCDTAATSSWAGSFIDLREVKAGSATADVDHSIFLTKDGTRQLTGNWNAGNYNITAESLLGTNKVYANGISLLDEITAIWNDLYANSTERISDNTTLTSMISSLSFEDTNASTACSTDEVLLGNGSCMTSSSFIQSEYNDTNLWNDLYLNSTERLADNATLSLFNINQSSQFDINQSSQFDINQSSQFDINQSSQFDINQSSQFDINQTGDIFTKYQESNNTFTELNTERIADNTTLTSMIAALSSYDDSWINATYNYLLNNLYLNSTQVDSLWSDLHLNSTRTDAIEIYAQANSTDQLNIWSDLQANSTERLADNTTLTAMIEGIVSSPSSPFAQGANIIYNITSKLGLGTSNPTSTLEIAKAGAGNIGLNVSGMLYVNDTNVGIGTNEAELDLSVAGEMIVGIGTTSGRTRFLIGETNGIADKALIVAYDHDNNYGELHIGGDAVSTFVIADGGYIGIGTVTPAQKLNVIGDVNITKGLNLSSYSSCNLETDSDGNVYCGTDDTGGGASDLTNYLTNNESGSVNGELNATQFNGNIPAKYIIETPVACPSGTFMTKFDGTNTTCSSINSANHSIITYTVNGTFVQGINCPSYINTIKVKVWSGGGSGSSATSGSYKGVGGGGGGYSEKYVTLSDSEEVTIGIGVGGAGAGAAANGNNGGASHFGSYVLVQGGSGGVSYNKPGVGGGGINGDLNLNGTYGSTTGLEAGDGGDSPFGGSGGRIVASTKFNPISPGGGSSGAGGSVATAAGANGMIVIEW